MDTGKDIISVVTVVFNGEKFIENTIKSVLGQTYDHIEYIIIDGGSTDRTPEIIKKYEDRISYWISEPDKGVYDAMNKGIDKARGQWINFMNAGDHFYNNDSISQMFSANNTVQYDAIYGDAEFRLKNIAYISESGESVDSDGFMPFSHQAVFVKTDVAKQYKFDLGYRITADTAFFLRMVKDGKQMKKIPVVVCSYDALQGLSADNELERSKEIIAMQVAMNGVDPNSIYFRNYIKNARIKQCLRKIVPASLWIYLRERSIKKRISFRTIK